MAVLLIGLGSGSRSTARADLVGGASLDVTLDAGSDGDWIHPGFWYAGWHGPVPSEPYTVRLTLGLRCEYGTAINNDGGYSTDASFDVRIATIDSPTYGNVLWDFQGQWYPSMATLVNNDPKRPDGSSDQARSWYFVKMSWVQAGVERDPYYLAWHYAHGWTKPPRNIIGDP